MQTPTKRHTGQDTQDISCHVSLRLNLILVGMDMCGLIWQHKSIDRPKPVCTPLIYMLSFSQPIKLLLLTWSFFSDMLLIICTGKIIGISIDKQLMVQVYRVELVSDRTF